MSLSQTPAEAHVTWGILVSVNAHPNVLHASEEDTVFDEAAALYLRNSVA